jgi:hypothetical protein
MELNQLPNHSSKKDRLEELVNRMLEQTPGPQKMLIRTLAGNYMNLFLALEESKIDEFLQMIKGFIDYVEYGND